MLHVCPECGRRQQQSAGGLVPVDPDVIRMAHCDAQHIGPIADTSPAPANDLQPEDRRDEHYTTSDPAAPGPGSAHVGAPARQSSCSLENQSADVDAAAIEKEAAARHETKIRFAKTRRPTPAAQRLPRAKQTIPPALRRAALLRDQHRCQVPGCSNARWLDVHHIELRSEGGRHSLQNLVCMCGAHHHAAHRGAITIDRSESGALRVRHTDGTEYGRNVRPQLLELWAKVFSALRHLGFREGQVRAALEHLQREPALAQTSFDSLLRAALARLRAQR